MHRKRNSLPYAKERHARDEAATIEERLEALKAKSERGEMLSAAEAGEAIDLAGRAGVVAAEIRSYEAARNTAAAQAPASPGSRDELYGQGKRAVNGVKGEPNEKLAPGVSMRSWVEAAAANGVSMALGSEGRMERVQVRDQGFMNDYFGGITGVANSRFSRAAVDEVRALGEGTAGSAINPIAWSASVIDYLYPQTILGKVGATRVPMAAQQVKVPQLTGVPSPTWVAENGALSLDAGPAFSSLILDASGGFKDILTISLELIQDAYVDGTLDDYLAQQIARRMALAVDAAAFYGIASNAGNPGLSNESGINVRKYAGHTGTTGQAPADTQELSVMAEIVRLANAEPTAFVSSPAYAGTLSRLNASTYAKFWDIPGDVTEQWSNRVASTTIPLTETDPASGTLPAQTGGTYSSVYLGDWSRYLLGVRLDLQTQILRERYIDSGQIGIFGFARYSTRASHPETFVRSYGVTCS
jgi:HK97 family phage major capsid protein